MKNIRISGKLSLIWVLALAAILCIGYNLIKDADQDKKAAAEVFNQGGTYQGFNNSLLDLLR